METLNRIMEIEKEKIDRLFETAELNTPKGEIARREIDAICYNYTHR